MTRNVTVVLFSDERKEDAPASHTFVFFTCNSLAITLFYSKYVETKKTIVKLLKIKGTYLQGHN